MKILENNSKKLIIYSRPIGLWLISAFLPIIGLSVASYFLEINSFNCKRSVIDTNFCQKVVIQTRHTQLIGIEIRQNEGIYQVEFILTDQYLELYILGSFFLLMNFSLYSFFFRVAQTRTCKFDKTINQLIIETKGLLGKKIAEYPLNEITDVYMFNDITTEPVYLILHSGKRLSVYVALDSSIWHQKAQDTVDLIKIFLGFSTKIDGIEKFQINSSDKTSRLCRIVYRSQFWLGDYITSIGDMPVKYDFWGHVTSIGDMPVKYGSSFLVHEHIISIGDLSIKYGSSFWGIYFNYCIGSLLGFEYITSIGDMSVNYSFINGVFYITSIGNMSVNYNLRGHIIAIGDMSIQCDSDGRLVEVHSSSGFNSKQFTVLFLLAKLKERPNNN